MLGLPAVSLDPATSLNLQRRLHIKSKLSALITILLVKLLLVVTQYYVQYVNRYVYLLIDFAILHGETLNVLQEQQATHAYRYIYIYREDHMFFI